MNIGRNDPCPCGSGKKFKKCCLIKMEAQESMRKMLEEKEWNEWFTNDVEQGKQNLKAAGETPPTE